MKHFLALLLSLAAVSNAAEPLSIPLWEHGAPERIADAPPEQVAANGITTTNVSEPGMKVYLPEKSNGMALVYCSGGSYRSVSQSSDWVGDAALFNARGIALIVVKYRTQPPVKGFDAALADARRAMRLTRHHAREWRIDPQRIGMLGGSAGAHLILRLLTSSHGSDLKSNDPIERESCRPAFAGLLCPWPAKNDVADFPIQKDTPPVFLAAALDDTVAPSAFAQGIAEAFQKVHVPATLWTIKQGGHPAFRTDSKAEGGQWAEHFLAWLDTLHASTSERPKLTPPYRLMYGYKDLIGFKPQPFWSDAKECERLWNEVFDRFNVVTGKTTDASVVKRLRERGIAFAYSVSNIRNATHKTTEDFVREWSKPLEDTLGGQLPGGFDGISIDELHGDTDGSADSEITINAVREMRRRFPNKLIITWAPMPVAVAGSPGKNGQRFAKGKTCDNQFRMVSECCDLMMIECYQKESTNHMDWFAEAAKNLSARAVTDEQDDLRPVRVAARGLEHGRQG